MDWQYLPPIGISEWLFETQLIFGSRQIFGIFDQLNIFQMGDLIKLYHEVFQSVHSCTSNKSSTFRPNARDILNTYFIKPLLHFGKQMNKETKLRIHNITAKAALKFGSEVWVLKKREEQRLEAAQMKFLRHLLEIKKNR